MICPECSGNVDASYKRSKLREYRKRAELKYADALLHECRRTATRNLVREVVPVPVAMKITWNRYHDWTSWRNRKPWPRLRPTWLQPQSAKGGVMRAAKSSPQFTPRAKGEPD